CARVRLTVTTLYFDSW
nr:immunoglobulin heavy chain junction region [Macaca mulatta]